MSKQVATIDNPIITYYHDLDQGSPEWHKARAGIITASCLKHLVTAKGKIANNKTVRNYAYQLAAERETGFIDETPYTYDMQRGDYQEVIARDIYDKNIAKVNECGFITADFGIFKVGGSPDGLVGEDGGIEIKSRLSKFQIETIVTDTVDPTYLDQVFGSILVSGRKWWEFVQYSNGMELYRKKFTLDSDWKNLMMDAIGSCEALIEEYQFDYRAKAKNLIKTDRINFLMDEVITASEG